MKAATVREITVVMLAGTWGWAGYSKLAEGGWLLVPALLELALAIALLRPAWRAAAARTSVVLVVLFAAVTAFRWVVLQQSGGCGCFGKWEPTLQAHFLILAGLGLASATLWRHCPIRTETAR